VKFKSAFAACVRVRCVSQGIRGPLSLSRITTSVKGALGLWARRTNIASGPGSRKQDVVLDVAFPGVVLRGLAKRGHGTLHLLKVQVNRTVAHLVAEGATGGTAVSREYVWLGDIPVATLQ